MLPTFTFRLTIRLREKVVVVVQAAPEFKLLARVVCSVIVVSLSGSSTRTRLHRLFARCCRKKKNLKKMYMYVYTASAKYGVLRCSN